MIYKVLGVSFEFTDTESAAFEAMLYYKYHLTHPIDTVKHLSYMSTIYVSFVANELL